MPYPNLIKTTLIIIYLIFLTETQFIYYYPPINYQTYTNRYRPYFYAPYADLNYIPPVPSTSPILPSVITTPPQPVTPNSQTNNNISQPNNQTKIQDNKTNLVFGEKDVAVTPEAIKITVFIDRTKETVPNPTSTNATNPTNTPKLP